ncbi:two-component regulator histidine sensor kinase [Caballeronia arvi]|uniref:Two-component regulator histidine sensor kinase n=1 Tax=Caballeronia arvi TaxID=1777135 RepID=A0A158L6Y4_9BURK|nr:response regulator [Caballeronia arvi]SAL88829.1 two-component regulator histidine sensor kinase [Caballeronia arvi]
MLFLFVDGDESVAIAFAELAASLGHRAEVARSGGDALRLTGQTRFDTVFVDIQLPDIDGRRLCNYIRCAGASQDACVVAVADRGALDATGLQQFDGRLQKPVTEEELTAIIQRC